MDNIRRYSHPARPLLVLCLAGCAGKPASTHGPPPQKPAAAAATPRPRPRQQPRPGQKPRPLTRARSQARPQPRPAPRLTKGVATAQAMAKIRAVLTAKRPRFKTLVALLEAHGVGEQMAETCMDVKLGQHDAFFTPADSTGKTTPALVVLAPDKRMQILHCCWVAMTRDAAGRMKWVVHSGPGPEKRLTLGTGQWLRKGSCWVFYIDGKYEAVINDNREALEKRHYFTAGSKRLTGVEGILDRSTGIIPNEDRYEHGWFKWVTVGTAHYLTFRRKVRDKIRSTTTWNREVHALTTQCQFNELNRLQIKKIRRLPGGRVVPLPD